jgi:hypothetical protein
MIVVDKAQFLRKRFSMARLAGGNECSGFKFDRQSRQGAMVLCGIFAQEMKNDQ